MSSIIDNNVIGHSDLINTTITSDRDNITGYYFYDKGWRIVSESSFVYSSLNVAFGYRWPQKHHKIISSKKVSSKKSIWLDECNDNKFNEVKV